MKKVSKKVIRIMVIILLFLGIVMGIWGITVGIKVLVSDLVWLGKILMDAPVIVLIIWLLIIFLDDIFYFFD